MQSLAKYVLSTSANMTGRLSVGIKLFALAFFVKTNALTEWERDTATNLGNLDLPFSYNRSTSAAQHFELGAKGLLHFWYDLAEEQFQLSLNSDAAFYMAYWGLSMSNHHFLWNSDNAPAAGAYLHMINMTDVTDDVERRYIEAARALFDENQPDVTKRVMTFADQMFDVILNNPEDYLAASYYAVAKMELAGTNPIFLEEVRAVLRAVLEKSPTYSSALHFILHAYDFPGDGIADQGVPYAHKYTKFIKVASHGDHMPAHLYIRLGQWKEAVEADRLALRAGDRAAEHLQKGALYDAANRYHSLEFIQYYLLQMGRYEDALNQVERMRGVAKIYQNNTFIMQTWYRMAARQILESRNYPQLTASWNLSLDEPPYRPLEDNPFWSSYTEAGFLLAKAVQAIRNNVSTSGAVVNLTEYRIKEIITSITDPKYDTVSKASEMYMLATKAEQSFRLAKEGDKNYTEAMQLMEAAVALQDSIHRIRTSSAPYLLFIPSYEYYADIIMQIEDSPDYPITHRLTKALRLYRKALDQRPNRAGSLLGSSRCLKFLGPMTEYYNTTLTLRRIWSEADVSFAELQEVRSEAANIDKEKEEATDNASNVHFSHLILTCCLLVALNVRRDLLF